MVRRSYDLSNGDGEVATIAAPRPSGRRSYDLTATAQDDPATWADEAWGTLLSAGTGLSSGVEAAGALLETVAPDMGEALRQKGITATTYLQEQMPDEWKEANEKQWATLNSDSAAWADKRAWVGAIAQLAPYMASTLGVGAGVGLGLRAAGVGAKKAAESGLLTATAGAGAGEAAAGAGRATDAAGMSEEERLTAMRSAAPLGAAAGLVLGKAAGKVLGEGTGGIIKRTAAGAAGEAVEEAGTQAGTEYGKTTVGLEPDYGAILESGVQGLAAGGVLSGAAGAVQVRGEKKAAKDKAAFDSAEAQAIEAELGRVKAAEDLDKRTPKIDPASNRGKTIHDARISQLEIQVEKDKAAIDAAATPAEKAKATGIYRTTLSNLNQSKLMRDAAVQVASKNVLKPGEGGLAGLLAVPTGVMEKSDPSVWDAPKQAAQAKLDAALADEAKGRKKAGVKARREAVAVARKELEVASVQSNALRMMRPEFEAEVTPQIEQAGVTDEPAVPPPPTKAEIAKEVSIKRSQAARAGADTKAAAKAPTLDIKATIPTAPKGNAEAQAISSKTSSVTQPEPQPPVMSGAAVTEAPTAAAISPAVAAPAPPVSNAAPPPGGTAPVQEAQAPSVAPPQKGFAPAPSKAPPAMAVATEMGPEPTSAAAPQTATVGVASPDGATVKKVTKPAVKLKPKPLAKMTVSERLAHTLSTGPKPMADVIAAMRDAFLIEKNAGMSALVERLQRSLTAASKAVTVTATNLSPGFQGLYKVDTKAIYIDMAQAENAPVVMLHEIIHALTADRLRNPNYRARIDGIRQEAMKQWDARGDEPRANDHPAFANEAEFVAHVLSDTIFADNLAALPDSNGAASIFKRMVNFLSDSNYMRTDPKAHSYFERLMDFIPDGTFLEGADGAGARAAAEELGMASGYASLLSTYRSALRTSASSLATRPYTGKNSKVWKWTLSLMPGGRIAQSYGFLGQGVGTSHDVINRNEELLGLKEAAATLNSATASRIADFTKNANDTLLGAEPFDTLMVNARLWSLYPSKPLDHADNAYGKSLPGSAASYAELQKSWALMTPEQRQAAMMMWDSSAALRTGTINQMMRNTIRAMIGDSEADAFGVMLADPANTAIVSHVPGIPITWQKTPDAARIAAELAKWGLDPKKTAAVTKRLNELHSVVANDQGPYSPLRRTGEYFAIARSKDFSNPSMPQAALDKLVGDNRTGANAPGDLLIISNVDNGNGTRNVTYRYETVSAHDTANEADAKVADAAKSMTTRGITIERRTRQIRRDVLHEGAGLKSASLEAMKNDVRKNIPGKAGEQAVEQITKWYLEHLPDTSVRKSQLKARKVKGADADVLAAYSAYTSGMSYMLAQMEYGPQLSQNLNAHATKDIKGLQAAGKADQADDLARVIDHLKLRDTEHNAFMATSMQDDPGAIRELWRRAPQLAGAYLLTGLGTFITNSTQVPVVAGPHFAARHGIAASSGAILQAMRDVGARSVVEAGYEAGRAVRDTPKSLASIARGGHGRSHKDPTTPFYKAITRNLTDPVELAVIEALVARRKIEHGLAADLRALAQPSGKFWSAVEHVTNAAFIMSQAVETTNRVVTALASIRLNRAANPSVEALTKIAAADIDQTQFNYANSNKSLLMQKEWMRQASTFKTYPVEMFYTIAHNMLQGFKYGTPQEKSIARKTLAGLFVTTMVTSGLVGVLAFEPFYWATVALLHMFADDDDPEAALRSAMSGWNSELAGTLIRGVPHGLHIADTGRMALPQLLPSTDIKRAMLDKEMTGDDAFSMIGETIAGAPGSLTVQAFQAAATMMNGDIAKGMTQLTPKMFGANDLARWYYQASHGVENTKGETVVAPEDVSMKDHIVKLLGFEPAELADEKMRTYTFHRRQGELMKEKRDLMKAYGMAQLEGDQAAQRDALADIRKFNAKHPSRAVTRTALVASITSRARSEAMTERYGVNARTPADRELVSEIAADY